MNRPEPVEGEERFMGHIRDSSSGSPPSHLFAHQFGDARAMWDEPALAELAAPDDKQASVEVDISQAEPAGLPRAKTEPVAEGEDRAVCRAALGGP
jgi:hypothetical protein